MRTYYLLFVLFSMLSCASGPAKLAYLTNRTGNFDIFLSDQNGTLHQALTDNPGWDWSPKWNKSKQGIIYNSNDSLEQFSIKLMSRLGKPQPLNTFGLSEFILSPNGKEVVYTQKDSNFQYIFHLDISTGEKYPLINVPAYNGRPKWSPNGKMISFISDRDGNSEFYIYDFRTQETTRLTQSPTREKYTSWGTNSKAILFTSEEEGGKKNDIFLIDLKRKVITQITKDAFLYEEICWSPDQKTIAFHGQLDGQHHIFTLSIDGTNRQQITQVQAYHGEPEWIPSK